MNQQQIDREIDILFLETPAAIFHFLCGIYDEKHLQILNEKFSNIISHIDLWGEMTERKTRIQRIQHVQTVIDKVIDYDTKLEDTNDTMLAEINNTMLAEINNTKIESDKKTSDIVFELEKTKIALEQMTLRYNIVEQFITVNYEILSESQETKCSQSKLLNKKPTIVTEQNTETQNIYTDDKIESLVCENESLVCENESLKNNNRNMSQNICRLHSSVNDKNREIGLLTTALSIEKAKNIKLNEAIKTRNDKIAEREKNPFADLMNGLLPPPSFNTNKK